MRSWRSNASGKLGKQRSAVASLLLLALAGGGCENREARPSSWPIPKDRIVQTDADVAHVVADADILARTPFLFAWGAEGIFIGERPRGTIDENGRLRISLSARLERDDAGNVVRSTCHVYQQDVDRNAVVELRRLFVAADFFRLGREYSSGVIDAPVGAYTLTIGNDVKSVSCSGACPKAMRPILQWMHQHEPQIPNITSYPTSDCP